MAYAAEMKDGIVQQVLAMPDDCDAVEFATQLFGGTWLQTSFNGTIRKNFAGIGYLYDEARDAFIAPEPEIHLGLDEKTCQWIVPISVIEIE